ncbi:hypothetical protein RF11_15880 [Thelohanellus kitauei]|uniref:Uncharacterized protein n=1 Tax=Thelohanellus kitauei TaxID=669202 RepID=A0A0C2IY25_THEKT|nr:hypothetical protein RF11_15880 [Thelohanellus kitauei]
MEAEHKHLLQHTENPWLARHRIMQRFYELKEALLIFINHNYESMGRRKGGTYDMFPLLADFVPGNHISTDAISGNFLNHLQPLSHYFHLYFGVEDYSLLPDKVIDVKLPFSTTYWCVITFSGITAIKAKYRSILGIENDTHVVNKNTDTLGLFLLLKTGLAFQEKENC